MSNTTKIPFSFCRIKRAADFLGVSTDDLLSLALSEKITLCVRLDGLKSFIFVDGCVADLTDWYLSLSVNNSVSAPAKNISKYSSFSIDRIACDKENGDPTFHPWFYQSEQDGCSSNETSESHKGRAFGLWVPQLRVINSILTYGKSSLFLNGSFGLYRTDEIAPPLCLIPLPLNHDEIYSGEKDDELQCHEEQYPDIAITENDLWITSEQVRELLKYNGDYCDLPNNSLYGAYPAAEFMTGAKKINHLTEHHATNREKLFKSAIYLLSKYPDECRGERKEISPEKWRDCISSHKDEIPPLAITNEEVILKHLRAAANGKV